MNLTMVTDSASQIAWAIKRIMEVDVVIVDDELHRIADTFVYPRQRIEIRKNSIVGRIIETGKPLAIDDKERFQSCIECPDFENCEMKSMIGVPIRYEERVIGAISLAISPRFIKGLFGNLNHTIGFLEKMAEMLAGKLQAEADYQRLNLAKQQREALIDSMDEAIVLVDGDGLISYSNTRFNDAFFGGKTVINLPVSTVVHHAQVEQFLKDKQSFEDKLIYCEYKGRPSFDGLCSARAIEIDGQYYGAVFTLKSINNTVSKLGETIAENYRLVQFIGSDARCCGAVSKARAAAKNDDPVLIEGVCGCRKLELAQAIHDASRRGRQNFFHVDCSIDSDERLEAELFGTDGNLMTSKLRLANKGTVCICRVDQMPRFLQRRVSDYLTNRTFTVQGREIATDTRLIFTAEGSLRQQYDCGMFDPNLYERIARQSIFLPRVGDDPESTAVYIEQSFGEYAQRYGVEDITVDQEVMQVLSDYHWPGDLRQLRNVVEYLVINCKNGRVTPELLQKLPFLGERREQEKSADELVEEQIIKLIASGKTRDEIASILKISRATLFRKLKKINSQGENDND